MTNKSILALALLALGTAACASGSPAYYPAQAPITAPGPSYAPLAVSYAEPPRDGASATSLWSSGPTSLFGDRRASKLGDIVTVVIELDEEAEFQNSMTAGRANEENFSVGALFGLPEWANGVLPNGATVNPAVDLTRERSASGNGAISRQEKLTLRLAAQVIEVLPNDYLFVVGTQEIRVNHETRQLQVTGLIRPEDITRLNTITYDKIAEARIAYGGVGQLNDVVSRSNGSKILNKVIPF
ncbi:flagellar basal body L-ring protein FlgH [Parvularcula flava]|uniref:Flagellar L-ring protein n=1 Tax=Aquisalinus luteolus TaxID=1566827 RepID=A0A8J3A057_9PROT|nr:flagellar basal body L-ring protein FlgH [Aquisalinus luteolus]NHK26326.1 flagellar basal body L-ring protein FlgH [Aquisalinus luteolus]GGH91995.1 flagellar L-ring protein [Aquisalinus luteolus]